MKQAVSACARYEFRMDEDILAAYDIDDIIRNCVFVAFWVKQTPIRWRFVCNNLRHDQIVSGPGQWHITLWHVSIMGHITNSRDGRVTLETCVSLEYCPPIMTSCEPFTTVQDISYLG